MCESENNNLPFVGTLSFDNGFYWIKFNTKVNGIRRERVIKARGMPKMEKNIFERYQQELAEGRLIRFTGHLEFDPDGIADNEALMFIEYLRFLKPREN